jgi:hypothetical protein
MSKLRNTPFYPLLLGIYPVLALLAYNVVEIEAVDALRPLLITLTGTALLLLFTRWLFKNWARASLVTAFVVTMFFIYGHVYRLLKQVQVMGVLIGRHRYLIALWVLLLLAGAWAILKRVRKPESATGPLNAISLLLLALPLFQITQHQYNLFKAGDSLNPDRVQACALSHPEGQIPPDVYYIIPDAYARADVLEGMFHYDNSAFLGQLESMGFQVADKSLSNYSQTVLSLSSALNMSYLEDLGEGVNQGEKDRTWLIPALKHGVVRRELECLGYTVVAFNTNFHWTTWRDADVFMTSTPGSLSGLQALGEISAFEAMLVRSSAGLILVDGIRVMPDLFEAPVKIPYAKHRERVLHVIDNLDQLSGIPGPKFVFAHFVAPHPPYIFDAKGEPVEPSGDFTFLDDTDEENLGWKLRAYGDQVSYINKRLLGIFENILAESQVKPIIILQADHGPPYSSSLERLSILNAYFLPDAEQGVIYESITPVNSFRVVFDLYFHGEYGLLEDRAYYSSYNDPYVFQVFNPQDLP